MSAISQATPEILAELRALFDLFDGNGDGLLEVEEVSAIMASCGTVLTEAEVLDMVTELKPDLRKLPFEEVRRKHESADRLWRALPRPSNNFVDELLCLAQFVNMISRPMVDRLALEAEIAATFPTFAGSADPAAEITTSSLQAAMAGLGRPIEPLVAEEMIREATKGGAAATGKISREDFVAMNGVDFSKLPPLEAS